MELRRGIDPAFARAVAARQGWTWSDDDVHLRFGLQPGGGFTAFADDGTPIGTATCTVWPRESGALAWIGSMLVVERHQRKGVGRALLRRAMDHAREQGADVVGLDATKMGRPLYEGEGFRAVGATPIWSVPEGVAPQPPGPSGDHAIYPVSSSEIMELIAYDKPRFGASRGPLLAFLISQQPHRSFVAVHRRTGAFSGLALGMSDRIGPLVADAPDAAAWLLHACATAGVPRKILHWTDNPRAAAVLQAAGYADTGRGCVRMALGGELPAQPDVYGLAHYSLG